MFRSKTVFVVGAGASCELDLPSGAGLKEAIARSLNLRFERFGRQEAGDARIVHALREYVGGDLSNIRPYIEKAWLIRDAMPAAISIDNYLDAHQGDEHLEVCGKLAIVKCILDAEARSKLRSTLGPHGGFALSAASDTWLLRFLRVLTEGVRRSDVEGIFDNVAMVVFNYDRCVERYLVPSIAEYYNLDQVEAISIVKRLKIYHPYGKVGALPWQSNQNVPFGQNEQANLINIAGVIKTFTEGQYDRSVIDPILKVMEEAKTLVFLGFAYHQQNINLIFPPRMQVSRVFGTSLGLSRNDTYSVIDSLQEALGYDRVDPTLAEVRHGLHLENLTCAGLFDEYSRSLTSAVR